MTKPRKTQADLLADNFRLRQRIEDLESALSEARNMLCDYHTKMKDREPLLIRINSLLRWYPRWPAK